MAKLASKKSIEKGLYAKLSFKCNGVVKKIDDKVSKEELSKMQGKENKTKCDHLLIEVK